MANDMNMVGIIGRVTRDPEMKSTQGGTSVLRFSIANNRRKKSGDQWVDEVNYFDVAVWGKSADGLRSYLKKGTQVSVSGELKQNRWEQDGQTRSRVEINAINVQLLGGGQSSGSGTAQTPTSDHQYTPPTTAPANDDWSVTNDKDSDVPF